MALRVISGILTIFLFFEGGATANNDDFDLPPISSYEAHRFGLDSTNQAQLQEFFHPTSPAKWLPEENTKSINHSASTYQINPTFVNGALWHETYDVEVENNTAYVSMRLGMEIFDVSNPSNPRLLNYYYPGNAIWDVQADDSIIFVTNGGSGGYAIEAINVADPLNPIVLSRDGYGMMGWGVNNGGRYVYVSYMDGPTVYDYLDKDTLIKVGYYMSLANSYSILKYDNLGFTSGSSRLNIFNMRYSQPTKWDEIGVTEAWSLAYRDNYVYVACCGFLNKNRLRIVDVSTPWESVVANDWSGWTGGGGPYAVKIVDSLLFMTLYACNYTQVVIASLADPINPQVLSNYDYPGGHSYTRGLDVEGNYCYVAHEHKGFSIGDVSDPTSPHQVGFFNPLGLNNPQSLYGLLELEIIDNYAYVLDYMRGLIILDITDPANPIVMGNNGYADTRGFDISGSMAYMAYNAAGVVVNDISDPNNLIYVSTYKTPGYARNVLIDGNYCYVAADTSGLQILDVTDPFNITRVGYYNADYYGGHEAYSIALKDTLALLGGYFGLQIINIKDPANPTPISRAEFGQYCWDIKVCGDMVYLALDSTIASVDISNPEYPYIMKTISDYGDDPFNLCLYDNYLLVANLGGGGNQVEIYDISTPGDMIAAGVIPTAGHYATDVAAVGKYIYVADYYGLLVMDGDFPIMCGDADGSRKLDLLDISATIDYLYRGGSVPDPSALDVDGSGKANLLDISYLLRYLYLHGPAPRCAG
jgi:hypothetical protein